MVSTATNNSDWNVDTSRRGAAFARTGMALMRETDEGRLIEHITSTCCAVATAEMAACSLCAVDVDGKPVDSEDESFFHIVSVVGISDEQRAFAHSVPLGSIGLLRPIFKHGFPVRIDDILAPDLTAYCAYLTEREASGDMFSPHVRDPRCAESSQAPLPPEHPPIRSFLGAPMLNSDGAVIGALLLGHSQPGHFSACDELLVTGLVTVAAASLENIRSCRRVQLCATNQKVQQEVEAQRSVLQLIIDEMPGRIYLVHGPEARLVLMNRAASALWQGQWMAGQPWDEFLRQSQIMILDENGVHIPLEQLAIMRAIQQRKTTYRRLEKLRYADGRCVPMNVSTSLIGIPRWLWPTMRNVLSLQDRGPLVVVVHQDITISIDVERLKDEFIDIAARELLAPLSTLRGCTQTLMRQSKRGRGATLTHGQLEAIEGIEQATASMAELSNHLLDVTRLQAGCLNIQPTPHDLLALVRRVVQRVQPTAARHQLNIRTVPDQLLVEVDVERIEQVLTNLIHYTITYSPTGGPIDLDISVGLEAAHVGVAVVSIQNHGLCIPPGQQAGMFKRFSSARDAHSCTGTGLELYLCRALIELHRGQIWFESFEDDRPTCTFYITLPIYCEEKSTTCRLPDIG
ncbi:GAF domain-containing sensor histidine kinase [Dictyobacter aurantiacus]|uniref:histidine kinase n=1 Tax=Dictyobacter aurantiacus TaxID=1936993 RepID=A0A401ZPI8_9CHLR|nr:GAF domain-containing sensor histidine kinase [Dictyobacter aurantiacus]GCE08752.1 hypothetical protein KDAU_60810 [Dictyobacter aurantiacus]